MLKQHLFFACLLVVCALSNGDSTLLTNGVSSRNVETTRDASLIVNVTVISTNMAAAMSDAAATVLVEACTLKTTVADRETYFRENFGAAHPTYNWNIFQRCGTYSVYADLFVILNAKVVKDTVTTVEEYLIFSSKI